MSIKAIFSTDLSAALKRARADERDRCETDKRKALSDLQAMLDGAWNLKVKELEAQIESMELRMRDMSERDKKVMDDMQRVREIDIRQRRLISDLVYAARNKHAEDTRELQIFEKLQNDIETNERQLLVFDKK